MNKASRLIKRYIALILVLLFSIESFAAVVGDNDGAAFITKAEFDSMKNDFQSQLDRYNSSLDNKIDGAIASYLSGVSINKQMLVAPLVKDYKNLKWKRKWEIKGSYKYYPTHRSADRQYYQDVWYVPHYQDIICLNNGMQFDLVKMRVRGGVIANLYGDWNRNTSVRVKWGFPVIPRFALSADPRSDDEIILMDGTEPGVFDVYGGQKILLAKGGSLERLHGQVDTEDEPYAYYNSTWNQGDYRDWGEKAWAPLLDGASYPPLENLSLTGNQVLNIYIYANYDNHRDWAVRRWHVVLKNNEIEPYQSYYDRSLEEFTDGYISDTEIENGTYSTNFWSKPAYFDLIKSGSAVEQKNDLLDLMLGKDFDWDAPLLRVDANIVRSGGYKHMVTTYSPWGSLTMDVKEVKIGGTTPWTADTYNNVQYSTTYPITWRVPSLEKYDFKKITSGKYVFNGKKLKFGQGLPIVQSAAVAGRLLVEFDYDIGRTVDTMPTSTNGIDIDIKKNDFLTADGSFYSGFVNDNASLSILHNLGINETSKHVKIVIENVAKDDNIWLRIAPHDTDGGLYAQMANLKATLITE